MFPKVYDVGNQPLTGAYLTPAKRSLPIGSRLVSEGPALGEWENPSGPAKGGTFGDRDCDWWREAENPLAATTNGS